MREHFPLFHFTKRISVAKQFGVLWWGQIILLPLCPKQTYKSMKLVEPEYEILPQGTGIEGVYKQIELCGRTCYASSAKIGEGSAEPFVERMVKSNHLAMCEHGTIYLHVNYDKDFFICETKVVKRYQENKYSKVVQNGNDYYITTNYRVLVENGWFDDLDYLCEPTEWHEKRITVRFTTQIAVSREANRHRVNSIAEQSTRYCNYTKDKFGGEVAINKPLWVDTDKSNFDGGSFASLVQRMDSYKEWDAVAKWWFANKVCEMMYLSLVEDSGLKPQDARAILPLDTNTELIHTAFVSDWKHFFELRSLGTTGKPHPDMEALAMPLMNEFKERGLI